MPSEIRGARLDIDALKKEHAKLDQDRRNAQANLNAAQNQLQQLQAEAKKAYGTDDLAELKKLLEEMNAENERKRAEYQAHLEEVQAKLAEVEKNFAPAPIAKGS